MHGAISWPARSRFKWILTPNIPSGFFKPSAGLLPTKLHAEGAEVISTLGAVLVRGHKSDLPWAMEKQKIRPHLRVQGYRLKLSAGIVGSKLFCSGLFHFKPDSLK